MASTASPASRFVARFQALRKTDDIPERLIILEHATLGSDGKLVLRGDVREPLEDLEARLKASRDAGTTYREAAAANALDVDHENVTHVVYALFPTDGGDDLYVGETSTTPAKRFERHPGGCTELVAAMEKTGGKDAWTCAVLLVLPESARSKELLLYIEARIQRLLDTVDGVHGRNCHYGAGTYGGAQDEERWLAKYVELIEFASKHGKTPSQKAKNATDKTLGIWATNQRQKRETMSTHRRDALEALGSAWWWRVNAPSVSNDVLFERLRADARVIASEGIDIPIDIPGVDAQRVHNARQSYRSEKMSEFDRAIVDAEFPGIAMTARNVLFYLNAKAFASSHPGAKTLPSDTKEKALYTWLQGMRNGDIDMTAQRRKVLEDLGLSKLLDTLKSANVRAERRAATNVRTVAYNASKLSEREETRYAKHRKINGDLAAGPPI